MSLPVRVIKLGGSLLDCADLGERLARWRAVQSPAMDVLIAGGGRFADAVREYDAIHGLSADASHRMAIEAMSLSARLVEQQIVGSKLVTSFDALLPARASTSAELLIFDVRQFMEADEPHLPGTPLPVGWHVTSDSIAARVAEVIRAAELVLLKSTLRPELGTLDEWARVELVDGYFPQAAARLAHVRLVNLRDERFAEQGLDQTCKTSVGLELKSPSPSTT